MVIITWTTERLSQDGNDVHVEWAGNGRLSVYEDDCEVATVALGLGATLGKADTAARTILDRIENTGTDKLIADLDVAIERAHQYQLDQAYAAGGE